MRSFLLLLLTAKLVHAAPKSITLGAEIYQAVPFSTQYSDGGALIRNVNYADVRALIPQLNSIYNINLQDRGEAHITVVTPPEFKTSLGSVITVPEMLSRYRAVLQSTTFELVCVGSRTSRDGHARVFYLVVRSPELFEVRRDLAAEARKRADARGVPFEFMPDEFWPHITIGYIKGDVFEFTKGPESCVPDLQLVIGRPSSRSP